MSGAAEDEAAAAQADAIFARVAATFRSEIAQLFSLSQEVPKLAEAVRAIEQFVDVVKPDVLPTGKDPVVCRAEHHHALYVVREDQAKTQTLAQELKARVDELTALKAQVDSVVARVPDDRQSQWIQGLSLELEQRVQEDVKLRLDATLKEYRSQQPTNRTSWTASPPGWTRSTTGWMNIFGG
jgi:archaellum component FlaC